MELGVSAVTVFGSVAEGRDDPSTGHRAGSSLHGAKIRLSGKGIDRDGSIKVRGRTSGTFWRLGPAWKG